MMTTVATLTTTISPETAPMPRVSGRSRVEYGSAKLAMRLQANSHDPAVRQVIGHAIRAGRIRVRPMPGDPERVLVQLVEIDRPRAV
jgi:hypothetical protein